MAEAIRGPGPAGGAGGATRAAHRGWWRRYWQIVPIAVVMWALDAVDSFRGGTQSAGLAHADVISRASDAMGGSIGQVMNQWTSAHPLAAVPATAYYIVLHVLVTGTAGVLLLRAGRPSFGLHRNALILIQVTGLAVFWFYPVAPPRMLPGYHDTAAATVPVFSNLLQTHAADQFASFPSLHVAWALWVAIAAGSLLRRRAWRAAVWAYPLLTVADVLATANHYLLDVVAAPAAVAAGYAAAAALPALARHVRLPRLPVRPAGARPFPVSVARPFPAGLAVPRRFPVRPALARRFAAWQGLAAGHAVLTAAVRAAAAMGTAAALMTGIPPVILTGEVSSLPGARRLARPPLTAGRAG